MTALFPKIARFCVMLFLASLALAADNRQSISVKLDPADSMNAVIAKAVQVRPSANQVAWQQNEFTVFTHFGMNTFTGKEWGNGKENPKLFNPTNFDADQWVRTCKAAGVKMIVLTAKHHDGFCLWPSKYTEHSVKNSPWKNGQGDVVREVADACHRGGIKFGVYLSPWDRHEKTYGTPAYNDYYKSQLRELLTNYGEVSEVWFDGAGTGKKHKAMRDLYDWQGFFKLVHELQPNAVVFNEGGDVRWVGNEAGKGRASEWSVIPVAYDATAPDLGSREKLLQAAQTGQTLRWLPAEVDTSIRPGWFYHKREDGLVKSVSRLVDIYFASVGGNAELLLNLPPDRRGLIHESDAARLKELRKALDNIFKEDFALHARAQASAVRAQDKQYGADKTVDGDSETYWTPDEGITTATIEYELARPATFNVAMLQENIRLGQWVEEFYIDVWDGQTWKPVAHATTIGYKRLLKFDEVTAQRVRFRIAQSRACPALATFGLFHAPKIAGN